MASLGIVWLICYRDPYCCHNFLVIFGSLLIVKEHQMRHSSHYVRLLAELYLRNNHVKGATNGFSLRSSSSSLLLIYLRSSENMFNGLGNHDFMLKVEVLINVKQELLDLVVVAYTITDRYKALDDLLKVFQYVWVKKGGTKLSRCIGLNMCISEHIMGVSLIQALLN